MGDVLRPKSFAGLFGAALSVALVSLALAFSMHGSGYVSAQVTLMMAGAAALLSFSVVTRQLLGKTALSAMSVTLLAFPVWLIVAFGLYVLVV
ncbi:MAG: hypothetical protein JWL86_4328 [Rhizobium sp.]|nr:hypothetical protein [Rhizobium sp.]